MTELDIGWFDNPRDEGQLKQIAEFLGSREASTLGPSDIGQLLGVFERFPDDDGFGVFWQILHVLESAGEYECALVDSVRRSPGEFNLAMINRLLNGGVEHVGAVGLLALLEEVALTEREDPESPRWATYFVEYQKSKS